MQNDEHRKYPKSYSYTMSPKELSYFIFKRKKCPLCNNKMKKYKEG